MREKLGLQEDDFVVLFVGRLIQIKGILELMQAVLSIPDEKVKLLVLGSANFGKRALSSYERKVKKISSQNRNRIIFTGYVDHAEVPQYASVADVQCVPSLWEEAAGLVVIEAMSEGLPTIVTNSGGMIEYVNDNTSLIVDRKDISENLKRAIIYLNENPEIRKRMSEQAKIRSKRYDEATYYRDFVKTIHEITGD